MMLPEVFEPFKRLAGMRGMMDIHVNAIPVYQPGYKQEGIFPQENIMQPEQYRNDDQSRGRRHKKALLVFGNSW